jgi:hypothetical protein
MQAKNTTKTSSELQQKLHPELRKAKSGSGHCNRAKEIPQNGSEQSESEES